MQQKELAKILKCTQTAVSRYENGTRDPDIPTIHQLCDIFGCTADYLLCRAAVPTPELSPEEEALLLAYRAADPHDRAIVDLTLAPYREDVTASAPTA